MSNEEMTKRGAAGMAKATAGRSRVFRDKKKYNRKAKDESIRDRVPRVRDPEA